VGKDCLEAFKGRFKTTDLAKITFYSFLDRHIMLRDLLTQMAWNKTGKMG
jgi:hypothetical protein